MGKKKKEETGEIIHYEKWNPADSIIIEEKIRDLKKYDKGRFLDRYKINFRAVDEENPIRVVRMDAHDPKNLHIHFFNESLGSKGLEKKLHCKTIEEMIETFYKEVFIFFGLKEEQ